MARGWNGFHIGDKVEFRLGNGSIKGTIIHLYVRDKSMGRIKREDGKEQDIVLDNCKKLNP